MFINKIKIRESRERPLRGSRGRAAEGGGLRHARPEGRMDAGWPGARYRLLDSLKSAVLGLLLLFVVVSVVVGSGMALFATMVVAWLLFPVLVGFRNVLEAGCAFMLVSVGILVVVNAAQHGPGYLLP
jgi:hypothetical protein